METKLEQIAATEQSRDPGLNPDRELDLLGKIVTYGFFTLLWAALLNSLVQLVL